MNNSISGIILNTSVNRSGLAHYTKKVHDSPQETDSVLQMFPKFHMKKKVCTGEIKNTCAQVSTKCEVSVENERVAVKTFIKCLYDHDIYLNIEERLCNDKEDIREPPPKIMKKTQH